MTDGAASSEPTGLTASTRERLRANGRKRRRADELRREAAEELGPLLLAAVAEGATIGEAARIADVSRELASRTIRKLEGRVFL